MPSPPRYVPEGCNHSILDRLLGLPSKDPHQRAPYSRKSEREDRIRRKVEEDARRNHRQPDALDWIIGAVKEDLRCLLSAARPLAFENVGPSDPIYTSLLTYGMSDLSNRTPSELRASDLLAQAIRDAIARFEPRLTDVQVRLGKEQASDWFLSVRIKAKLLVDTGGSEPVDFNTSVYLGSRRVEIDGGVNVAETLNALPA